MPKNRVQLFSGSRRLIVRYFVVWMVCILGFIWYSFCQENINVSAELKNIKSKNHKIKVQAIEKLGKAKDRQALKPLKDALKTEKDSQIKLQIVNSLGQIGDKEATPELKKLAKEDKSKDVRAHSCLVLGTLKDELSVETLKEILLNENEDENVRISAGASLTFYISEPKVKETLEKVLKTDNRVVKFGLVNSLRHIRMKEEGKYLLNISAKDTDEDISNLSKELLKEE